VADIHQGFEQFAEDSETNEGRLNFSFEERSEDYRSGNADD